MCEPPVDLKRGSHPHFYVGNAASIIAFFATDASASSLEELNVPGSLPFDL